MILFVLANQLIFVCPLALPPICGVPVKRQIVFLSAQRVLFQSPLLMQTDVQAPAA
jgi:hypothetical protein